MKYVNKVMALGLAILFLTALIIGTEIILSVRNVNVGYKYYGENLSEESYNATRENLNALKGTGMLFIGEDDITSKLDDDSLIAVERYEKVYPCTLNVYLKQRVKTFAVKTDSGYDVYDDEGKIISSLQTQSAPQGADGCPLVLIENVIGRPMEDIAVVCSYFEDTFGDIIRKVNAVSVGSTVVFNLRSGISIRMYYSESDGLSGIDKTMLEKAYTCYLTLSDSEKVKGEISVLASQPSATYGKHSLSD